ncbi:MAG: hypothetical protein ACOZCF_01090 [Bacillota bacterium]
MYKIRQIVMTVLLLAQEISEVFKAFKGMDDGFKDGRDAACDGVGGG